MTRPVDVGGSAIDALYTSGADRRGGSLHVVAFGYCCANVPSFGPRALAAI